MGDPPHSPGFALFRWRASLQAVSTLCSHCPPTKTLPKLCSPLRGSIANDWMCVLSVLFLCIYTCNMQKWGLDFFSFFLQMSSYYKSFGSRFFFLPSFLSSSPPPFLLSFLPSFSSFLLPLLSLLPSPPSFLASSLSLFLSLLIKWMFIKNYLDLLRSIKYLICIQIIETSVGSIHLPQVNYAVC